MVEFVRLSYQAATAYLARMVGNPKWDLSAGLYGVDDIIGGGVAYLVQDQSGPLVVIVVQKIEHTGGRELVVRAAWQLASCGDLTETVMPCIEQHFGFDCDVVTFWTKRPGLVVKMNRAGYTAAATMMRKKLK